MNRHYEVCWARSNRADVVAAIRSNARRHATEAEARDEARTLVPPSPDVVALVIECRTEREGAP